MPKIFISYRRSDSEMIVGRIYDRLELAFGRDSIFKDVYNIPPGEDFRATLQQGIERSDVMLVVIGPDWLDARDAKGQRRLDDPDDSVRFEVGHGLKASHVSVIPVLVGGASIPRPDQLPAEIRDLAFRNALPLRKDPDFGNDFAKLLGVIRTMQATRAQTAPSQSRIQTQGSRHNLAASAVTTPRKSPLPTPDSSRQVRFRVTVLAGIVFFVGAILLLAALFLLFDDEDEGQNGQGDPAAIIDPISEQNMGNGFAGMETKDYFATYFLDRGDVQVEFYIELAYPTEWHLVDDGGSGAVMLGNNPDMLEASFNSGHFPPDTFIESEASGLLMRISLHPEWYGISFEDYGTLLLDHMDSDMREPLAAPHPSNFEGYEAFGLATLYAESLPYYSYALAAENGVVLVELIAFDLEIYQRTVADIVNSLGVESRVLEGGSQEQFSGDDDDDEGLMD